MEGLEEACRGVGESVVEGVGGGRRGGLGDLVDGADGARREGSREHSGNVRWDARASRSGCPQRCLSGTQGFPLRAATSVPRVVTMVSSTRSVGPPRRDWRRPSGGSAWPLRGPRARRCGSDLNVVSSVALRHRGDCPRTYRRPLRAVVAGSLSGARRVVPRSLWDLPAWSSESSATTPDAASEDGGQACLRRRRAGARRTHNRPLDDVGAVPRRAFRPRARIPGGWVRCSPGGTDAVQERRRAWQRSRDGPAHAFEVGGWPARHP